jgi:ubiquitin-protein ligase
MTEKEGYNAYFLNQKNRTDRIDFERKEFNDWKSSISCSGETSGEEWLITMDGPKDSPYFGGKFKISITFPKNYPTEPPEFKFLTDICHINIDGKTICMDTLKKDVKYKSSYTIVHLLSQIFLLLSIPNEDNAYRTYRDLYRNDYSGYLAKAREMTREYAK